MLHDLNTIDTELGAEADWAILQPASPTLPITVDSTAFLVAPPSMVIGHDGRPVIAHLDFGSQLPEVATCQTSDCRSGVLIHEPSLLAVPRSPSAPMVFRSSPTPTGRTTR